MSANTEDFLAMATVVGIIATFALFLCWVIS